MTDDFTASSGVTVGRIPGAGMVASWPRGMIVASFGTDAESALREFFQHETDTRLNRWRSKDHPEFVVYPVTDPPENSSTPRGRAVDVVREGGAKFVTRWEHPTGVAAGRAVPDVYDSIAREYFTAHPAPKPAWHEAKAGEVWVVTVDGDTRPYIVTGYGTFDEPMYESSIDDAYITAAHRIWPPVEDAIA